MAKKRSLVGRLLGGSERDYNYKASTKIKRGVKKTAKEGVRMGQEFVTGITNMVVGGRKRNMFKK